MLARIFSAHERRSPFASRYHRGDASKEDVGKNRISALATPHPVLVNSGEAQRYAADRKFPSDRLDHLKK
jgi:hypothetical protein